MRKVPLQETYQRSSSVLLVLVSNQPSIFQTSTSEFIPHDTLSNHLNLSLPINRALHVRRLRIRRRWLLLRLTMAMTRPTLLPLEVFDTLTPGLVAVSVGVQNTTEEEKEDGEDEDVADHGL